MSRKYDRGYTKKEKYRNFLFLIFVLFIILIFFIVKTFNQRMLPIVLEITELNSKTQINRIINDSMKDNIEIHSLNSADFYIKTADANGNLNSLSVNTILVNQICSQLAVDISEKLSVLKTEVVAVPVGTVLGIDSLSNIGPKYKIKILPLGDATVNYESSFTSVGINQINFQIWLNIESAIKVVNPLQSNEIKVTRKMALVDTVFSGEIPKTYINTTPIN